MPDQAPQGSFVPNTPFVAKTVEVKGPSGRVYVMHELSMREQMLADGVALSPAEAIYLRTGLALDSINGETIPPRPKKPFVDALMDSIPGEDGEMLCKAYVENFAAHLQGEEVKN